MIAEMPYVRVPGFSSKFTLRRLAGQISQSRLRAYPRPNDPPPMLRDVIADPSRGQVAWPVDA
jgi:hypothetical protein